MAETITARYHRLGELAELLGNQKQSIRHDLMKASGHMDCVLLLFYTDLIVSLDRQIDRLRREQSRIK